MKLLFCPVCWDVFKLDTAGERACKCGRVKGAYDDNGSTAWSNGMGVSLAIGNGSLLEAIDRMKDLNSKNPEANRHSYIDSAAIRYVWARPDDGPGNPHCRVENSDE